MNLDAKFKAYYQQRWVLGVSGGADSMALLDMAFNQGVLVEVVHVHYHQRRSADYDCQLVEDYCIQRKIPFHRFDAPIFRKGNFQQRARLFRYASFKKIMNETGAQGLMVAHHLDDVLETYLFQKQRNSKVSYFGIQEESYIQQMRVRRPLLSYDKEDILAYCKTHNIAYGEDESNQSDKYVRNQKRKELAHVSPQQKQLILQEIKSANQEIHSKLQGYRKELRQKQFTSKQLIQLIKAWPDFLVYWLRDQAKFSTLSQAHASEIQRQLLRAKHVVMRLNPRYRLIKQYDLIRISVQAHAKSFQLNKVETINRTWIRILTHHKTSSHKLCVHPDDFPIHVMNAYVGMKHLDEDTQHKVRRLWIKHKIPLEKREDWPLFFMGQQEYIGCPWMFEKGCFKTDKIELYVII